MTYTAFNSSEITSKSIKMMFWGDTSTRKTETVLRNFPDVCVFDPEGNAQQCADMPEIPDFKLVVSKDPRVAIEVVKDIVSGKMRLKNGNKIQTLSIDSASVLWSVGSEAGAKNAEERAKKYGKEAEAATMTQLDWGLAKRYLKQLNTAIDGSGIPYIIYICREKDLYDDNPDINKAKKIGVTFEAMKGTAYEMNLGWHFGFTPADAGRKWYCQVTKCQGGLGKLFPEGTRLNAFPSAEIIAYATKKASAKGKVAVNSVENEDEIADSIVKGATPDVEKTMPNLIRYAGDRGLKPTDVQEAMKKGGFNAFLPSNWDAMIAIINANTVKPEKVAEKVAGNGHLPTAE